MKSTRYYAILPPLLITLIMLGVTFLYWQTEEREWTEKRQLGFAATTGQMTDNIRQRLLSYELILRSVKGFFEGSDFVSREEYRRFIDTLQLAQRQPGLLGVAVVESVTRQELIRHQASKRRQGFAGYTIWPASERPLYAPVTLVEPYVGNNVQLMGFDIASNPVVRPALELARDTGGLAMTGRLTLAQDASHGAKAPPGVVMYLPVYAQDARTDTLSGRRGGLVGWVSGPIRVTDLIASLISPQELSDISLDIYEGARADSRSHLYGAGLGHSKHTPSLQVTRSIDLGGRQWTLVMYPLPGFEERFNLLSQWQIVVVGGTLSLLMGWLVWLLITRRERAERLAHAMTLEMRKAQADLEATLNAIPDVLFELGLDGRLYKCNTSRRDLLPDSPESFLGKRVADVSPVLANSICLAALEDANHTGFSFGRQIEVPIGNESHWYELSIARKDDTPVNDPRFIMIARDITERVLADHELRIAATAFESQDAMFVTDENQAILRVNNAFTTITGYSLEDVIGQTPGLIQSQRQDTTLYEAVWERLKQDHFWQGEIWNRRKNGEDYPERLSVTSVRDGTGRVTNYIGLFSDISNIKQAEDRIHSLAFYDTLTGLPNRQLLQERLKQLLSPDRGKNFQGAILFINLDDLKSLNDTRGHDSGDLLLIEIAKRIKTCVYPADIVARMGGDEFVVVLDHLDVKLEEAAKQAEEVAQRIRHVINRPVDLSGYEYHCTACIGISLFRDHEVTQEELLKHADSALYQAKHAGRDKIHFFDIGMQAALEHRVQLLSMLHNAIPDQLVLYYQLQADKQGKIFGAEVLIRWMHPEKGIISPLDFIPLAEESGLILPIGRWVLEAACTQIKSWELIPQTRDLQLSVNVSAMQFHQPDFVDQVQEVLALTGANPTRLKLELTESMLLENIEDIIGKMNALKEQGVSFSLDDFGTGYSSLSFLKRLPLDQLKIDKSFVQHLLTDANDAAIVRAVITLGQSLGLGVIAEGVETEEQCNFLAVHGCHFYQGYWFGKPVPLTDFEDLLKK